MDEPTTPADNLAPATAPAVITPVELNSATDETASPSLRDQATAKAQEFAHLGKEKASELLENLTSLTDEVSAKLREKLGDKYPQYLTDMAGTLAALAVDLRAKDVGELVDNTRDFVRKRPAVAIGAAAAAGFLLARMMKSGNSDEPATDTSPTDAPTAA
jgi:ElaB/YqjD/DUF883 family membrane-anchored ribosome-binding protein